MAPGSSCLEQDFALDAQEFGHIPLLSIRASAGAPIASGDGIKGLVESPQPGKRQSERAGELGIGQTPPGLAADFERVAQDRQALGVNVALDEQLAAQKLSGRHPKPCIDAGRHSISVRDRIFRRTNSPVMDAIRPMPK